MCFFLSRTLESRNSLTAAFLCTVRQIGTVSASRHSNESDGVLPEKCGTSSYIAQVDVLALNRNPITTLRVVNLHLDLDLLMWCM